MSEVERKVRDHFHADAQRFDSIYKEEKGIVSRFIDGWWRGVVKRRLELNLELLAPIKGKTILDVGCGSGRFCIAFAERGAARVVGIDFASAMVELAQQLAQQAGVSERCTFIAGTFPEAVNEGPFDATTANGFFDYVEHPVPIITRMRELTRETMIMSFPKAGEWRTPVRRLRFWLKGTPLFLYSESRVKQILAESGVTNYDWIVLDRDFVVVAHI
jgi:2-polyprenyl-3-methyl-5-hydroxy-6-metoxy-1,4-benzoquinol methylase